MLWTPTEDFDANFKVMVNSQERNAGNASSEPFCINGQTQPVLLGTVPLPGADCEKNQVKSHGSVAPEYAVNVPYANGGVPYLDSKFTLASLNLNWRFDALTLTSTTGYYDQTVQQLSVSDWSPYATIWAASKESYELITQEMRANTDFDGPVNFMAGVYYEDFDRPFFNSADLFHVFNPVAQNYATVSMDSKSSGNYFSGFAQIRWNILPDLELAGGARYSEDEKDIRIANVSRRPAQPTLLPVGQVLTSSYEDDNVSPEATLTWRPDRQSDMYVAYKTGYKAGGMSNPFLVYTSTTRRACSSSRKKRRGMRLATRRRCSIARCVWTLSATATTTRICRSSPTTRRRSASASTMLRPPRSRAYREPSNGRCWTQLTLRGNVGYNRAKYESYANAQCYPGQTAALGCSGTPASQNLEGKALLRAPELTYSLGADYAPAWCPDGTRRCRSRVRTATRSRRPRISAGRLPGILLAAECRRARGTR